MIARLNPGSPPTAVPARAPRPGENERLRQTIIALVVAAAFAVIFYALPSLFHAHREYLLWTEGFMERVIGASFLSGTPPRLMETPKPLWNLFWLLSDRPDRLYPIIALLVGVIAYLFQDVSRRLTGGTGYGLAAAFIVILGCKDVLNLLLSGNWTVPVMVLGLLFLSAMLGRHWTTAAIAAALAGLIRPEWWSLGIYLLIYVACRREKLKWHYFAPLLAPLLWALYDYRLSGDLLYSYRTTAAYALVTGARGTNLLTFWPKLVPDVIASTGVVIPLFALAGMVLRGRSLARQTERGGAWSVALDPLLVSALLPLLTSWLFSLPGNLIVMRRFFYLSISLWALYAMLLPFEFARLQKAANRRVAVLLSSSLVLATALVRVPAAIGDTYLTTRINESKMAGIVEICGELDKHEVDPDEYRSILVPFRRLAQFRALLSDDVAEKIISYRELRFAVASTKLFTEGTPPEVPPGSAASIRELALCKKGFDDFLPALALWVPDDEQHDTDAFSFDDPKHFRKDYLYHGRYAFRIIGAAPDTLGLVYDVRELAPDETRPATPRSDTGR